MAKKHAGPRMTITVQLVLRAMLAEPTREMYGLQICQQAGLPSGTIHPILARLEALGWLRSYWEDADPQEEGRPRRRYYKLTDDGAGALESPWPRPPHRHRRGAHPPAPRRRRPGVKDALPSVTAVLGTLNRAVKDAYNHIHRGPDLKTVQSIAAALSDRCLDAIQLLDALDEASYRIIHDLNSVSFAAHELAQGISNGCDAEKDGLFALAIGEALKHSRHPWVVTDMRLTSLRANLRLLSKAILRVPGMQDPRERVRRHSPGSVTSLARTLLAAAARLVPVADRPRYAAEFRAELADIAAAGGNRRAQVAYAARLVAAAPRLRIELKVPRRRRAPQ